MLRDRILHTIVDKLLQIDVEIKLEEFEDEDEEEDDGDDDEEEEDSPFLVQVSGGQGAGNSAEGAHLISMM